MTTDQRTAGEAMFRALGNALCGCTYEHPYHPRGKQKTQCARCRSMGAWLLATAPELANPAEAAAS